MLNEMLMLIFSFCAIYVANRLVLKFCVVRIIEAKWRDRAKRMTDLVTILLVLFCAGLTLNDKMSAISLGLGAACALALVALKEIIADIAGRLMISTNQLFHVGDRVQIGKVRGDIIEIGFFRTSLLALGEWVEGDHYNGRIVRVFNRSVFKEPVMNYSEEYPFVWDEIDIELERKTDFTMAEEIIKECAGKVVGDFKRRAKLGWEADVQKNLHDDDLISVAVDHNGVKFTLRYVTDHKFRRRSKEFLNREIKRKIKASQGEVITK